MQADSDRKVLCKQIHDKPVERKLRELSFRPSVYGVIEKEGKVLLTKEFGGYGIPGGGVDIGEPLLKALVREIKEETGYDIIPGRVLHVEDDFFIHPAHKRAHHSILLYFSCELQGGALTIDGLSAHERSWSEMPEWVPLKDAAEAQFTNPVEQEVIQRYQASRA